MFQWSNVPQDDQNGVILSYTVTYKAFPGGSLDTITVNASKTQVTLTGLNEYTNYSITVVASTVKGAGIVSSPIIVITDEDSKLTIVYRNFTFLTFNLLIANEYEEAFFVCMCVGGWVLPRQISVTM